MICLFYLSVFFFGASVGSFLNVVIHRLPRGKSFIRPRSACPGCGHCLGVLDLVPILSFLCLGARCRYCRRPISWRYPMVEALTGAVFILLMLRYGLGLELLGYMVFAVFLIAIAFIDLDEMIVPDKLSLPGLGLGLAFALARGWLVPALIGALAGGGFLLVIYFSALFLLKKEGLGLGDAKLLAMVGAFLGWEGTLFTILIASISGSVLGLFLIALGRLRRGEPMPFGPYIAGAALLLTIWPWTDWLGPWLEVF